MELNQTILETLSSGEVIDSYDFSIKLGIDHQAIVGAIKSLQCLSDVIDVVTTSDSNLQLTPEGLDVLENGSHEAKVFKILEKEEEISKEQLLKHPKLGEITATIGLNKALQNGWLQIKPNDTGQLVILKCVESISDVTRKQLEQFHVERKSLEELTINELKRRKLIAQKTITRFIVKPGLNFGNLSGAEEASELTTEMIENGSYEKLRFKKYNFDALGYPIKTGNLHPLMKVRDEFVGILLEMGFSEMNTNRFVESSFWNFDTLFVPQKHPARDLQDTFFVSKPRTSKQIPVEYMEKIKKVHSVGDYGSIGYGSDWKYEETERNILRTHTTAISARVLYELGKNPEFVPIKKFSIDRVFRNETLDATHLAEFHQVEGFVADRNLNLGHLIGVMKEFFGRMGLSNLRFKPAYNPYTEPSMEVFAYHSGFKKWVEIGNSGLFRPEMLRPANLPPDVRVIAWGLSLERPTMIRYGFDNIRDLVGSKVDLKMVYKNPLCRFNQHQ